MKFREIQGKGREDMDSLEANLRKELSTAWLQVRSGQATGMVKVRTLKKDIARVLTAKRAEEIKGMKG